MEPTYVGGPSGHWASAEDSDGGRSQVERDRDGSGSSVRPAEPASVLIGDVRLSGGSLALDHTLDAVPEATFVANHHTLSSSGERTLYLAASGAPRERVEDGFTTDPTVVVVDSVGSFPDRKVYRITLSDSAVLVAPTSLELGARALSVRGNDGCWHAQLQFSDRDALVALRLFCTERDVRFGLDSLYHTDRFDESANALTDKQWETLRTAFESGYYDIPRKETQDDLATKLGVSTTAVSHRLRRATSQLVRETLGALGDRRSNS